MLHPSPMCWTNAILIKPCCISVIIVIKDEEGIDKDKLAQFGSKKEKKLDVVVNQLNATLTRVTSLRTAL